MKMVKTILFSLSLFFCSSSLMAMDHVTVLLDWFINPDHAPLIVAQQQGFFKKQGLHVDLIPPADPADPIKLVAAGQADIGVTYQPEFTMAVSQGLPLVRIGSLINHPLGCLLTLSSRHISTLKDLKGKKIGFDTGNNNHLGLKTMLNHAGLQLTDVKLINLHFDEVEGLLTHQVDAVNGVMRNFEPIELELAGQPGKTFYPEDYGVPIYDELIYIVNKRRVNEAILKKFMIAMTQATDYLIHHPQSCWDSFSLQNPALNNELNRRVWFATMPYFAKQPAALDVTRYENYTAYLKQTGTISTMPALNEYAVDLFSSYAHHPRAPL